MTLSNLINLAVLLMTGIALWVTILQARDARISRTDAARSAASAALSARDRVEALTRTAGATEQIAGSGGRSADALERIAEPSSPWTLVPADRQGGWILRNESPRVLHTIRIATLNPDEQHYLLPETTMDLLAPQIWSPNESELLRFDGGTAEDPTHLRIVVDYTIDGEDSVRHFKGRLAWI